MLYPAINVRFSERDRIRTYDRSDSKSECSIQQLTCGLVNAIGFEPMTVPIKIGILYPAINVLFSERDRIRTYDRLLRRQMLYPAELRVPILFI
jgi:hypothetical protein